jgi:predicted PurR-regulated permease PerM
VYRFILQAVDGDRATAERLFEVSASARIKQAPLNRNRGGMRGGGGGKWRLGALSENALDVRTRLLGAAFLGSVESMAGVAVVTAIIIGALYFGRELFVPIALAILLSFVLAPLVRVLQRWHVPRGISVVGVVLLAFLSIFALGGVIATQVAQLAGDLPRYEVTMREKIKSVRGTTATSGTLERAADVLQDLGKELNKPKDTTTTLVPSAQTVPPGQEIKPIPVEVRQPPPTTLESIAALISPLLRPLTTTGIMAIFVVFILLQREDLRNRFIKLAGSHDLQKTTVALDDAATRLSRLFLIQLALNTGFGIVIGAGLWAIGVPSPGALGHSRRRPPLRPLYRRLHFGGVSVDPRGCCRSRLVDAVMDRRVVSGGGAASWPCDRAVGLRSQHRLDAGCRRGFGDVLDGFVGTGRPRAGDTTDGVPGHARPARGALRVS